MNFIESFKSAIYNVQANKMRSFLTMLGIIIGISSVITIVSIGQGGKKYITGQFESFGTNSISVKVKSSNNDIESRDYFTLEDADLIKDKVPKVKYVIPATSDFGSIKFDRESKMAQLVGITQDYLKGTSLTLLNGRFINAHDVETSKNAVVIDDITAKKFFNTTDATGNTVKLKVGDNLMTFIVVGVIENPSGKMASMFGDNMPGYGFVPITVTNRIFKTTDISDMSVILSDMNNSSETANRIIKVLENKHRNSGKYAAEEGFKQLDTINKVLGTFTAVIGAIAAISLLVGGIGVMNIMLVSVTERTREIGIRKAIGAKDRDIKLQFLSESLILCLIGGTIGMILGILIGMLAGKIINVAPSVSPSVIIISFLFSSAVGIFFGLYPANQAAKLDPIEALRYE